MLTVSVQCACNVDQLSQPRLTLKTYRIRWLVGSSIRQEIDGLGSLVVKRVVEGGESVGRSLAAEVPNPIHQILEKLGRARLDLLQLGLPRKTSGAELDEIHVHI